VVVVKYDNGRFHVIELHEKIENIFEAVDVAIGSI
jgi:hypothetical protein